MRLSRLFRIEDGNFDDAIPIRRIVLWVFVWIAMLAGIVLYFQYAALLAPLLSS